jgi:hypothetical protein
VLALKNVGPALTSSVELGDEMDRKTTAIASTTKATHTAYAIFLSCRTRSTKRRRIVRGIQDSRSLEENEFYAANRREANVRDILRRSPRRKDDLCQPNSSA